MNNRIKSILPAFGVITLLSALMILGLAVIPLLSVQLEPSARSNSITINFSWPKVSAEVIEREVTAKLEGTLSIMVGLRNIRSESSSGYGYIVADLDEHSDANKIRYEVATLIRQIYPSLPNGVSYPLIYTSRSDNGNKSILTYTINGNINSLAIRQFVEKNIKPQLAFVSGVHEVKIFGADLYAWELQYDPEILLRYQISVNDISSTLSTYFKTYELGKAYSISHTRSKTNYSYLILKINHNDPPAWESIPIKKFGSRIIYLTDIVKVRYTVQDAPSYYRINGLNTVNLEIVADKNTNQIILADKIKELIDHLKLKIPLGYSIILVADSTEYLKAELNKIVWRSVTTLLILLIFVFAASRDARYLFLISASLLCNLLLAFIVYYFLKLEIQVYSLAAITISMGLIIDNSIVVIDHIRHKQNIRIFLAVAGTSLTTIGSVCIIFLLDESKQEKLIDFAWIMIVNLSISMLVSLLFVPAMMEKLPLRNKDVRVFARRRRKIISFGKFYLSSIKAGYRNRLYFIVGITFLFGIPVFILPDRIESPKSRFVVFYNATIGSQTYGHIRPWMDGLLGGTLRLFFANTEQFSYIESIPEKTHLTIDITMPQGATIKQMDALVRNFEHYLSQFSQIAQFQSRILNGQEARIEVLFKKDLENDPFPYELKKQLENKALYTGLAEFDIHGVGRGFNNKITTEGSNYGITLLGYNYLSLRRYADQVKNLLSKNSRVRKIAIYGSQDRYDNNRSNYEFVFHTNNPEKQLINNLSTRGISKALEAFSNNKRSIANIFYEGDNTPVILSSVKPVISLWQITNEPMRSDSGTYVRLKEFSFVDKEKVDNRILRENQQYQLVINYSFIGDYSLGFVVADRIIKQVGLELPLGYTIKETEHNFWQGSQERLTWAILVTIGIVFIICSILLNSLKQSFAIITLIPISYIGVFLTSYIFEYHFDEGGYAAFIVLCGIVVSAALYILNDYNNLINRFPFRPKGLLYVKAYNSKIIPVILTRISIILGLVPFIIYSSNEPFWYALAMSVTGGVLFSFIALIIFLPLFLKIGDTKSKYV